MGTGISKLDWNNSRPYVVKHIPGREKIPLLEEKDGKVGVNVRAGQLLDCMPKDGDWHRCRPNDAAHLDFWVSTDYVMEVPFEQPTLAQMGVGKKVVAWQREGHDLGVAKRSERNSTAGFKGTIPNGTEIEWHECSGDFVQVSHEESKFWIKAYNLRIPAQEMVVQNAQGPLVARTLDGAPLYASREDAENEKEPLHYVPNGFSVELLAETQRDQSNRKYVLIKWTVPEEVKRRFGEFTGYMHWSHLRSPTVPRGAWARCVDPKCASTASCNGLNGAHCCSTCAAGTPCKENVHQRPESIEIMLGWARCARKECACQASWNGAQGEYCCVECREGKPCTENRHVAPTTPVAQPKGTTMKLFHGTSKYVAEQIVATNWRPSTGDHLLGRGVYFVEKHDLAKAQRFAHDFGDRMNDLTAVPVVIECTVEVGKVMHVTTDYRTWETEGYDACRASKTSMSKTPEWCVTARSHIKIDKVTEVSNMTGGKCPFDTHPFLKCRYKQKISAKACPCEKKP